MHSHYIFVCKIDDIVLALYGTPLARTTCIDLANDVNELPEHKNRVRQTKAAASSSGNDKTDHQKIFCDCFCGRLGEGN